EQGGRKIGEREGNRGQKKKEARAGGRGRGEPVSTPPATTFSPAVRRIVEEEKLKPEKIRGTGEGGRLTKRDVLEAVEKRGKADLPAEASAEGRFIRKKMSPLRRKIAQQLVMSQQT